MGGVYFIEFLISKRGRNWSFCNLPVNRGSVVAIAQKRIAHFE